MDEKEPNEVVDTNSNKELIEILKEFLKDTNLEKIITSVNQGQVQKLEAKKDNDSKNLTFWKYKFIKEFLTVLIILVAIFGLALLCKIEDSTLGTLLGSVIGYAIGNFSSSNNH